MKFAGLVPPESMHHLRDYLQLVRLPNVFTALADVLAGYWLLSPTLAPALAPGLRLSAALLASACLYSAGIALNDIVDRRIDMKERPDRPLAARRLGADDAMRLVLALFGLALLASAAASWHADPFDRFAWTGPFGITLALIASIILYNLVFKNTTLGPLLMGLCRALNLGLGMSAARFGWLDETGRFAAAILFLYVASLTYFGRHEAFQSARRRLFIGAIGIGAAILLLGWFSFFAIAEQFPLLVLWLALAIHLFRRCLRAIRRPEPPIVQSAMKTLILSLIVIDALLAGSAHGWPAAIIVLALLAPAIILGRRLYST